MSHSTVIILVNWNGIDYTTECINSIIDEPADIIVVDNGSEDDSVTELRRLFPHVQVIESKTNLGFTGGNNLALREVMQRDAYEYVLLLNNDTVVRTGLIDNLQQEFKTKEDLGAIQPLILQYPDQSLVWNAGTRYCKWFNKTITKGFGQHLSKFGMESFSVPWLTGCAFMVKVEALKKVGVLDDRFFAYYEDVDLSFRLRQSGYTLRFFADAIVYHHAGVSTRSEEKTSEGHLSPMVHYLNIRNRLFILRKHLNGGPRVVSFTVMLVEYAIYLVYFLLRGRIKKFSAVLRGIKDGIILKL